jgi:RimJ/RimL family protein N-acetyltransferase
MPIILRDLRDPELDLLFEWEQDARAIAMAAFTHEDPTDRAAFDAHYDRIRNDPAVLLRAIDDGSGLVGTIGSFTIEGDREITYWISPARWGEGIASAALAAFLDVERTRPLYARAADHNLGSIAVLARAGFERIGGDTAFANGVGREVSESVFRYTRT